MPVRRADDQLYVLGSGLTATGASVNIPGGEYHFLAVGTLGTATDVQLQILAPDGATWMTVQDLGGSNTVKGTALPYNATPIYLPAGAVRVLITGTATSVSAWLAGMG